MENIKKKECIDAVKGHFSVMKFGSFWGLIHANYDECSMSSWIFKWNLSSRGHVQHFTTNTVWHCTTASENSISTSDYDTVVAAFKFQMRCFFRIKPAIRPHLIHFLLWWKYSTTFLSCCCNSFWYETSDIFCFIKKKWKSRVLFVYFFYIKTVKTNKKYWYLIFRFIIIYS